jgi:hypothetical protein
MKWKERGAEWADGRLEREWDGRWEGEWIRWGSGISGLIEHTDPVLL